MIDSHFSFYDNQTPWSQKPGQNFLIRGFAYRETMPRGMIRHGDKTNFPWPWLLIYFHDPVTIMSEGTLIDAGENTLMVWPPGSCHHYGNAEREWTHSWLTVDFPEMPQFQKNYPLPIGKPCGVYAGTIFIRYLGMFQEELKKDSGDFSTTLGDGTVSVIPSPGRPHDGRASLAFRYNHAAFQSAFPEAFQCRTDALSARSPAEQGGATPTILSLFLQGGCGNDRISRSALFLQMFSPLLGSRPQ